MADCWDQKKSMRLLDEYEKARLLWDPKNSYYYAKPRKQEAWEALAKKFDTDVDELKRKMNSLLGSFRRERSKTRRCLAAGKEYNSRWFAYEKLKFLLDQRGETEIIEDVEIEDALNFEMNLQGGGDDDSEEIYEIMLDETDTVAETAVTPTSYNSRPIAANNKRFKHDNTASSSLSISSPHYVKLPSTSPHPTIGDEFDAIGMNVAAKLRCMKSTQRIIAEKLIHDALFYGQLEKLSDTSCLQSIQTPLNNSLKILKTDYDSS